MKVLLVLAPLAAAFGQDALSLPDAVALGIQQNQSLAAAGAALAASQEASRQARAGMLPKVQYSESLTRSNNPVFVFGSLLTQHQFGEENFQIYPLNRPGALDNFQSVVSVDQPLYDGGVTRNAVRAARLGEETKKEDGRRARMDIIFATVRAYYTALLAAKRVEAAEQSARSAEADLARAESIRDAGMATDVDVLSIKVHLAAVREELIQRSADLDVARAGLNDAMGLPLDAQHNLTTALSPINASIQDADALEQAAPASRSETREMHLAVEIANTDTQSARNAWKPSIAFHAAFEADRQHFASTGGANWLACVSLHWNLFNGFADQAKIAETAHLVRRAEAEQSRADSAVRLQVRRAYADLRAARERILATEASVAQSAESLRITKNRYDAGMSNVTDLIRNETAVLDSRTRQLSAIYDERVAVVMLEYAAGTLSTGSEILK